ncbi:MAG TPA: hypothetical protein H9914_12190 [Candidatus Blautia avicola]|uniref:Vitamin B12 dependent methionine synthase, activation domain n=1 Tax=Candidatus Blautia avicola TaxID=2838483 RepID=A0A9D2QXD0_9FIRM|nr:hypothetical protein [Candidatus Blautia avicola]
MIGDGLNLAGKVTDIKPCISREEVFRLMGCHETCEAYETIKELYEEILPKAIQKLEPAILYRFGRIPRDITFLQPGTPVVYTICTVGEKIEEWSSRAFKEGNPVEGMLLSAIADSALFHMDDDLERILNQACAGTSMGIKCRMEAPQDIPMEAQKLIFHETGAKEQCAMALSEGYMFYPVKSSGILFLLTEDKSKFAVRHECRNCRSKTCRLRQ